MRLLVAVASKSIIAGRALANDDFAPWLVKTLCTHRLAVLADDESSDAKAELRRHMDQDPKPVVSGRVAEKRWLLPGSIAQLIEASQKEGGGDREAQIICSPQATVYC